MSLRIISLRMLLALTIAVAATALLSGSAHAQDGHPCGPEVQRSGRTVQFCPLVGARNIPVYAERCDRSKQVGVLRFGGDRNWFLFQVRGDDFIRGGDRNNMWAFTQADR